ncbi:MAG: pilin [Patescibacteria group bacterium]
MKKQHKILFLLFFGLFFLLNFNFALALEMRYPPIFGLSINDTSSFPEYAKYFFNIGISIAGLLAVIVIAWGGILWMFGLSIGKIIDPKKGTRAPAEAKEWIKSGITGLIIVMCSYLLAYTINPNLVIFKLDKLGSVAFNENPVDSIPPGAKITTFQEIPIGSLTETALTRTIDCYGFDQDGNPIEGEQAKTENNENVKGPTYLNHDRADCLLQLADGAQKKAKVANDLSNEIIRIMNSCSCSQYGKCESTCDSKVAEDGSPVGCKPGKDLDSGEIICVGPCVEGACKMPSTGTLDCCPTGIKDKIQHGPIKIGGSQTSGGSSCSSPEKEYKGLDEFRTKLFSVSSIVEKQVRINGKTITIIDKNKWNNLKLIEQLMYFKEKMRAMKDKLKNDINILDSAKSVLSSSRCYLTSSSVGLFEKIKGTRTEENVILIDKTFADPETGATVNASKYCKGFNYGNSSCFKKCNDTCPDSSQQAIQKYKECGSCKPDDAECLKKQEICVENAYLSRPCTLSDSSQNFGQCIVSCRDDCSISCSKRYNECSDEFKICQEQCKDNSKCVLDPQNECLFNSQGFQEGANNVNDTGNAKYNIDNAYLCKYGSNLYAGYSDCLKSSADKTNYSSSYIYQNQNKQKCPKPYQPNPDNPSCSSTVNENAYCSQICPETLKCPSASRCSDCPCDKIDETITFSLPKIGGSSSSSSSSSGGGGSSSSSSSSSSGSCPIITCPDGTKSCNCPTTPSKSLTYTPVSNSSKASLIATCQTTRPDLPNYCSGGGICINGVCQRPGGGGSSSSSGGGSSSSSGSGSGGGEDKYSIHVTAFRITGPECSEYAYNDDPLTFYCEKNWWDNKDNAGKETPVGKNSNCPKENEIPVGQTVDDTQIWLSKLQNTVDTILKSLDDTVSFLKKIGDKDENQYCQCTSKYDTDNKDSKKAGKPICKTDCKYNAPATTTTKDPDTGEEKTTTTKESCSFLPCGGNPCQQIIDYLLEVSEKYRQLKLSYIDFYVSSLYEGRTDLLKELTYSREKTNYCSLVQNVYGSQAQLLSCTRVQDELISSVFRGKITLGNKLIQAYCYGQRAGTIFSNKSLTDNWFCCDQQATSEQ